MTQHVERKCKLVEMSRGVNESIHTSGMSSGNHESELIHWAAMCKDLYGLSDDDEAIKKQNVEEKHCVSNFGSKFEQFQISAPSALKFLGGKGRLYRKLLKKMIRQSSF
jgi:hypothetical protein